MKKMMIAATILTLLFLLQGVSIADQDEIAIRGSVAEVVEGATYSWTLQNFAGFYYDLDEGIGAENLTVTINESAIKESGAVYTTFAEVCDLEFEDWGTFWTMGFLGEGHFVGYASGFLYNESDGMRLLEEEKLARILIDDDEERTLRGSNRLSLEEDYRLEIDEVDLGDDKVYLKLFKDGVEIDSSVVEPSKENASLEERTYLYTKPVGSEDVVFIAVHFRNAFGGSGRELVTVDGVWQISDETLSVEEDEEWDKMSVQDVDPENMTITMSNEDTLIRLSKDRDASLMDGIRIRTADQDDVSIEDPLRFYIYKEADEQEVREIRGGVAEVENGTFEWNNSNFAGFYYDLDEGLGRELLVLNITGGRLSELSGAIYHTEAQEEEFEFEDWGRFWTIAFLGEPYFAGYSEGLFLEESDEPNMLDNEQLTKVLMNVDRKKTMSTDDPIRLEAGYKLVLDSVDGRGEKAYIELFKDGEEVDSSVVEFFEPGLIEDETYTYKRRVGGADDVVVVAVHFRRAFMSGDDGFAEIDGIWQISDDPIEVEEGDDYDKMTVDEVSSRDMTITMNNREREIMLDRDDDITLMGDIGIKTADQDEISADEPLRFYVYKSVDEEDGEDEES